MLHMKLSSGRAVAVRGPSARPAPFVRCRSGAPESSSTSNISTADRSAVEAFASSSDEKVKSTLSSLDALLGPEAAPKTPTVSSSPRPAASSSAPASTSSRPANPSWMPQAPKPATPAQRKPNAGMSFDQVMGFSGLAPEVINGRAAMIGFVCAMAAELKSGESVYAQMVSGGAAQALIVIAAVALASFAPAVRQVPWDRLFGKDKKPAEFGPFTPVAEIINGRAAMIGIALLILFEGAGPYAFFLN